MNYEQERFYNQEINKQIVNTCSININVTFGLVEVRH